MTKESCMETDEVSAEVGKTIIQFFFGAMEILL